MKILCKSKFFYGAIFIALAILFLVPFCFAKNITPETVINRNWGVPIFYALLSLMSLGVLVWFCIKFEKKYFWLLLTLISVCVCNAGYLALSLSCNIGEALLANKIAYLGNCFLPLFLLVTIADACRFRYNIFVVAFLFLISISMYVFVATSGYLNLFYKNAIFEMNNGVVSIQKTYGIMHTFYLIYILIYFTLMIALIFYSYFKGKLISPKHVVSLLAIVFVNVILWLVEKFINIPIEILSFSYIICSVISIHVYRQLYSFGLLDFNNIILGSVNFQYAINENLSFSNEIAEDYLKEEDLCNYSEDRLKELFSSLSLEIPLTEREIEIAVLIMKNYKRKKIADFLFITEHTVKFHISNIYKKTKVNSRSELAKLIKNLKIN